MVCCICCLSVSEFDTQTGTGTQIYLVNFEICIGQSVCSPIRTSRCIRVHLKNRLPEYAKQDATTSDFVRHLKLLVSGATLWPVMTRRLGVKDLLVTLNTMTWPHLWHLWTDLGKIRERLIGIFPVSWKYRICSNIWILKLSTKESLGLLLSAVYLMV